MLRPNQAPLDPRRHSMPPLPPIHARNLTHPGETNNNNPIEMSKRNRGSQTHKREQQRHPHQPLHTTAQPSCRLPYMISYPHQPKRSCRLPYTISYPYRSHNPPPCYRPHPQAATPPALSLAPASRRYIPTNKARSAASRRRPLCSFAQLHMFLSSRL